MRRGTLAGFLLVLALLAWPSEALAQRYPGGFKIGVNMVELQEEGGDLPDFGRRLRFVGGGFLTFRVSPRFAIQPELLISQKGGEFDRQLAGQTATTVFDLSYWELPLLARFHLFQHRNSRTHVVLGPAFGFNRDATVELRVGGATVNQSDLGEAVENVDVGLMAGLGIELRQGGWGLLADLRYTHGTSNVFSSDFDPDADARNRSLSALFGVVIY